MKSFDKHATEAIAQATFRKTADIGIKHAHANQPFVKQTIANLLIKKNKKPSTAIVLCAGPSLHLQKTAEKIRNSNFNGIVIAADGALGYCLRNGLIPDYVVCVDPHPHRIVRWFGDTKLSSRPPDNYFRRQDLDPHWLEEENKKNDELIALVNKFGPRIPVLLSTSVAPSVTARVFEAKMPIFWWNPIYDDYDDPSSVTRRIYGMNGIPCIVTGGNCGTSAWVLAGSVLKAKNVIVTGMDLSYPPKTKLKFTQYYYELRKLYGSKFSEFYIQIYNPYLKKTWFMDPTYWWYRKCFLEMAKKAPFKTINCTEGGVLFGRGVQWGRLESFLAKGYG